MLPTLLSLASCFAAMRFMREESCGGHFRVEHQTDEGEALRNDVDFTFVGVVGVQG